jgi:hypothetical protein
MTVRDSDVRFRALHRPVETTVGKRTLSASAPTSLLTHLGFEPIPFAAMYGPDLLWLSAILPSG